MGGWQIDEVNIDSFSYSTGIYCLITQIYLFSPFSVRVFLCRVFNERKTGEKSEAKRVRMLEDSGLTLAESKCRLAGQTLHINFKKITVRES